MFNSPTALFGNLASPLSGVWTMTFSDDPPPVRETARMGEELARQTLETDEEYVKRLLIALSDVRQRAQTLSEELTQAMRHLGVPLPPDKES
jgi:hypothetical protein